VIDSLLLRLSCVINYTLTSTKICAWNKSVTRKNSEEIELYVGVSGAKDPTVMTMVMLVLSYTRNRYV
jgi:hypothetical protein